MQELWYTRRPEPTAIGIAADLGWLDDEFTPEGIALQALGRGEPHASAPGSPLPLRDDGSVSSLWDRSRGAATRLVGLTWAEERQAILARPYVTIRDPEDLEGRRLGLPLTAGTPIDVRRATALRGLQGALWAGGLTLNDAHLIDIPGAHTPAPFVPAPRFSAAVGGRWRPELESLARGEVDAVYVTGDQAVAAAQRYGLHVAIDLNGHPDPRVRVNDGSLRPITVHQTLLDARPDLVTRFLSVLLDAAEWAAAYPGEAVALWRETAAPSDLFRPSYGSFEAEGFAGSGASVDVPVDVSIDLSAERLGLLAEQERFLRTHGFLESSVSVGEWADPAPLAGARSRRSHSLAAVQ